MNFWADDGVLEFPFHPPGASDRVEGKSNITKYFGGTEGKKKPLAFPITGSYPMLDPTMVLIEFEGKLQNLVTEEHYTNKYVVLFQFNEAGKVTLFREYFDSLKRQKYETYNNNAGIMPVSPLIDLKLDDWNKAIDINIRGVLHGIAAVLPHMSARSSGHIINIGSIASLKNGANFAVYCGTKFAVRAISECLRKEMLGKVRVTIIYPGAVESELVESSNDRETSNQVNSSFDFISPSAISQAVRYAIEQPDEVSVNEIVVRPSNQEF